MSYFGDEKNRNLQVWSIVKGSLVLLVIAFIILGVITFLNSFVVPGVLSFFSSISTLDSAIVVTLITGAISIFTYVAGTIVNQNMKRNEYLRSHREEPYMQLISIFYDFQTQSKTGKQFTQKELIDLFNKFNKELTLWGSSKAIKVWGNWRVSSAKESVNSNDLLFGMEKVLIQLRKDMGQKRGLSKGDLLRLTVNDIDDYIGPSQRTH